MALRNLLAGGDRRSNRQSNEVLGLVLSDSRKLPALMDCLWDDDACVRMRAADALEKFSRDQARLLQPFKKVLLELAAESMQREVRWHLAALIPRLQLTKSECERAAEVLKGYLSDRSSIVKTFAMQGLADLAVQQPETQPGVTEFIQRLTKTGTPAMRARGRKLLGRFGFLAAP